MPMVNGKKYPYTAAGKAAARKARNMNQSRRVTGVARPASNRTRRT